MKHKDTLIFHRLFILRFFYLFFLIPSSYVLFFLTHPRFLQCPDQHNVLWQTQDNNSRNTAFDTQAAVYDEFV